MYVYYMELDIKIDLGVMLNIMTRTVVFFLVTYTMIALSKNMH